MKSFSYTWDDRYFLLHLQINKEEGQLLEVKIVRKFCDNTTREESVIVRPSGVGHRFLVTRTHPNELAFVCFYPSISKLEVYKLDDRAYYPTHSFYAD